VKLLLETQLPLWHLDGAGKHRTSISTYPARCLQYFKLCAQLVPKIYASSADVAGKALNDLVLTEVNWILALQPPEDEALEDPVLQTLITGHMIYLSALLTCCDESTKSELGERMIQPLVNVHLFPASRQRIGATDSTTFVPICDSQETRMATLAMVIELCKICPQNSLMFADLVSASHNSEEETRGQWDFKPMLAPRSEAGFVGLQNAGATCYMNS
jgi:ubiquitin carboxyl-terminal hydrolase 9/24